ncbi:hypothetical protein HUJ04_003830 [Dendroctonus ponderosae]|nr:hypothetical protein HUJ04_003830 [Dendroctonus ponderosae]
MRSDQTHPELLRRLSDVHFPNLRLSRAPWRPAFAHCNERSRINGTRSERFGWVTRLDEDICLYENQYSTLTQSLARSST